MPSSPVHMHRFRALVPGDTIGVVAPASPFDRDKFHKGISVLEGMGLHPVIPASIDCRDRYLAGSDVHRAAMLTAMFEDPNIPGIICARGGYGALRLLPSLNFNAIAANPKVFIGSSDITILLNLFHARSSLVCFHGPMVESLASATDLTIESLRHILFSNPMVSIIPENRRVISPGRGSGTLVGGNLTVLCHLLGTPFEPDFSGRILLLEDVGEAPYRIDRMLTQMKLAGCFEKLAGIVLGSFKDCGETKQLDEIFSDIFSGAAMPIMAGFPIGHEASNLTVPIGLTADLDTVTGVFQYTERPFSE